MMISVFERVAVLLGCSVNQLPPQGGSDLGNHGISLLQSSNKLLTRD